MKKIYGFSAPCFVVLFSCLLTAQVTVPIYQYDNSHSGTNTNETILTPSNVNVSQFGRKMVFPVQGYVYAQPLYVPNLTIGGTSHNVLFVATEHDQLYAFDVNSGQQLWHTNFLATVGLQLIISTVSSSDVNCGDLVPEIGITATPVIDTTTNTLYVSVETKEYNPVNHALNYRHKLHVLDITTGLDKVPAHNINAVVRGIGTGSLGGVIAFNALLAHARSSLLLADGQVIVSFASHCDLGNYHGWLMSFDQTSLNPTGVFIDTPNGYEGGFWGGGSGPAADAAGSIYAATGNGWFDVNSGGIDYGDSVLRLTWSGSGLSVADYFTPWDQQSLDDTDKDVNSGGVVLLPDQSGPYPHLLIQVGKEGTIDLINRDNMGHFHSGNDDQIVQTLPSAIGGIWGGPAFWNNNAYFGGVHDHLKAFAFNPQTELLSTSPTSESPETFAYPGPTPAVSSSGTSNGIVWVVETDNYNNGGNAILRAYLASNLGTELYNSQQNPGRDQAGLPAKFAVPTVADGHVFVAAQQQVDMYGLLN
jgi:outer membrane protein assembly factor BamB